MAKTKLPKAYLEAIETMKSKGFGFIKVELEAQLNRGYADSDCGECDEGYLRCDSCGSEGYYMVTDSYGDETETECDYCSGAGEVTCGYCNGRGTIREGTDIDWCADFMRSHMGDKALNALIYDGFYDDGSVDSEYTFTMSADNAHLALDVIRAFNELNREINGSNYPDVDNAGMHITAMPSGSYPCHGGLLNSRYMDNFKREVTKLLPALYFVASHNKLTRSLYYRQPNVSEHDKYSAIYTHNDTCLEFRIFDTCYDQPTALLDKIQVIAASLKYYSFEKAPVKYRKFVFPADARYSHSQLSQWYQHLDNYDALNRSLKQFKPKNKTLKSLKAERGLNVTRQELVSRVQRNIRLMKADHARYVEQTKLQNAQNMAFARSRNIRFSADKPLTLREYVINQLFGSSDGREITAN